MKVLKPLKIRRAGTTIPENNDGSFQDSCRIPHLFARVRCALEQRCYVAI